ncbi:MAG: hypothetical protein IPL79_16885 [Myxococcales bacterium]|nr:hypothetical protein [Myxococcales bacterium]
MTTPRLALIFAAACASAWVGCDRRGEPTFQLTVSLATTPPYSCGNATCADVEIGCDAVAAIRIVDARSGQPYVSVCEPLPFGELCGLGSLALPQVNVPIASLQVSVVIWPASALPDDGRCPTDLVFDAFGFPLAAVPVPALGGQTYFTPGDDAVVDVTLGCLDVAALSASSCDDPERVRLQASVYESSTLVPVGAAIAERIEVSFGEPVLQLDELFQPVYRLPSSRLTQLVRQAAAGSSVWVGVASRPVANGCIHVLDDLAETVASVTCGAYDDTPLLAPHAYLVDEARRDRLLAVLGLSSFPDEGLLYGLVIGDDGEPLAGAQALPSLGQVHYLEPGQLELRPASTSAAGDFVSTDVPYSATWSLQRAQDVAPIPLAVVGGLISQKLTVVVLRAPEA